MGIFFSGGILLMLLFFSVFQKGIVFCFKDGPRRYGMFRSSPREEATSSSLEEFVELVQDIASTAPTSQPYIYNALPGPRQKSEEFNNEERITEQMRTKQSPIEVDGLDDRTPQRSIHSELSESRRIGDAGMVSARRTEESIISRNEILLPVFREAMLAYYIKKAIYRPVCVLFRKYGPISELERQVHALWIRLQMQKENSNTTWRFGAYLSQSKPVRGFQVPDKFPVFRCYIGTAHPADCTNSADIQQWFSKQVMSHKGKIPEFNTEALDNLPTNVELVLVVFVNAESHHDLESHMKELMVIHKKTIRILMVHPESDEANRWTSEYGIKTLPAIIVLDTKCASKTEVLHKFDGSKSSIDQLKLFLGIRTSPIIVLTMDNFESLVLNPAVGRSPLFVCFHASWGRDPGSYLDAVQRSVSEFCLEDGSGLNFGSVDLTQHAEVVTRWVDATYAKSVPFSVLFWWKETADRGPVLHQKLFPNIVPTPWNVATFLEQAHIPVVNAQGEELRYSPWVGHHLDNKKTSAAPLSPRIGNIPQVKDSTWSSIVERSRGAPDRLPVSWTQDVAPTTLVAFIQADCSSCRLKMPVFESLKRSVKTVDGAAMYIMNCTSDPKTCSQLRVIGFPTLIAFRGYNQIGSEHCVTGEHANQLIRMDFHSVLEEKLVMEWFSEISLPAVKLLSSVKQFKQSAYRKADVILLAITYPLSLAGRYLPVPTSTQHWYPLECFHIVCERLYGRASCVAALSDNLSGRDLARSKKETDMIVTQVEMIRRDGIKTFIFSLGRSLMVTLQDEEDSQIHVFHSPHKYKLQEGQKCEDDLASCTDLIVEFVQDHCRLPVTHLTMSAFHTHSGSAFGEHHENSIFEHGMPVLIALARTNHLKQGVPFIETLTSAAYELYNQMVFVSLDVDEFPQWAAQFVPLGYRQKILEHSDQISADYVPSLNIYPRLCIVRQDDHRHAAMFPLADRFTLAPADSPRVISRAEIVKFARDFLGSRSSVLIQTEQF